MADWPPRIVSSALHASMNRAAHKESPSRIFPSDTVAVPHDEKEQKITALTEEHRRVLAECVVSSSLKLDNS